MNSEKRGLLAAIKARIRDPLRRNADALILGTGLTSALGLVFWALAARWLPTSAVGIGAALMSIVALLANFSTLGLRNGLLRFLPVAGSGTLRLILTCYAACAGAAMLAAGIFLIGQPIWAEKLGFIRESPVTELVFVLGTAVWVIFVLQDYVLIGLRRSVWVPVKNGIASILKIAALPLLASAAAWAIFTATVIPAVLAVLVLSALVLRFARHASDLDLRPRAEARVPVVRLVRFAAADHLASLLWIATDDVLILIVLHLAGAEASAYWYIAFTIGYALYLVTSNVGAALIAESAYDPERTIALARKALLHSAQLVVPVAIIGVILAPFVLDLMGPNYAENATPALQFILLSAIPQLFVGIGIASARARGDMRTVIGVYSFIALFTWTGCWIALGFAGLTGMGIVILVCQSLVAIYLVFSGRSGLWPDAHGWKTIPKAAKELPDLWRRRRNQIKSGNLLVPALAECAIPSAAVTTLLTSESDTLVVAVGNVDEPLVLKIATSHAASDGLARHAESVERLDAELSPEMSLLLPRVLCRSTVHGSGILLESRLPGLPATDLFGEPGVSGAALAAIVRIHERTGRYREVDDDILAGWIDAPLAAIRQAYIFPGSTASLDRISTELHTAWHGRQLLIGYVHGDFWPGNVLIEDHQQEVRVSGIVDWENASRVGLPDSDLMHWWLTTQPGQLGSVVLRALENPAAVREGLASLGVKLPNSGLEIEHVVLQTWLGHVSAGLSRASNNRVGLVWLARNVAPVVRWFGADYPKITAGDPK